MFSRKSCRLWHNVENSRRAGQASDNNMAHALEYCITKATNTYSEYLTLTAFPRQPWVCGISSILLWHVYCLYFLFHYNQCHSSLGIVIFARCISMLLILDTCSPLIIIVLWVKLFLWSYIWSKLITITGPSLFTDKYLCLVSMFQDFQRILPDLLKHCVLRNFVKHMTKRRHYCGNFCVNFRVKHLYFARLTRQKLNYNNVIVFSRNPLKNTDNVNIERFGYIHQQTHIIRNKSYKSLRKLLHVTAQRCQPDGFKNTRNLSTNIRCSIKSIITLLRILKL
jgi:hypothetical protein